MNVGGQDKKGHIVAGRALGRIELRVVSAVIEQATRKMYETGNCTWTEDTKEVQLLYTCDGWNRTNCQKSSFFEVFDSNNVPVCLVFRHSTTKEEETILSLSVSFD